MCCTELREKIHAVKHRGADTVFYGLWVYDSILKCHNIYQHQHRSLLHVNKLIYETNLIKTLQFMATVHHLLPSIGEFFATLQDRWDYAETQRHRRHKAAILLQRMARGYLIRKYVKWLHYNATIIQCAWRRYKARQMYRQMLKEAVKKKHAEYYNMMARRIQGPWRSKNGRSVGFDFYAYKRWLATVKELGERRTAEAAEFAITSRADDLRILEEEARKWMAYVVFKLHHLLRTTVCAGIYSNKGSTELSEFEKLLNSIHYTEYMKRLKRKYDDYVRKNRPRFSNKRLFPIIGDGADYWYLSLPEMYELTRPSPREVNTRHVATHRGDIHEKPFMWRRVRPTPFEGRGPFLASSATAECKCCPCTLPQSAKAGGRGDGVHTDPRFHLYVKHYTPQPKLFDYVDFHVNALLNRKCEIFKTKEKLTSRDESCHCIYKYVSRN